MIAADLSNLDLLNAWYDNDPAMQIRVSFPFFAATGYQNSAVVYVEIEPSDYLGTHTDGAEEILLIMAGTVEATLGDEGTRLSANRQP
jgi:quercetin dioxygenase-like cupin family protein